MSSWRGARDKPVRPNCSDQRREDDRNVDVGDFDQEVREEAEKKPEETHEEVECHIVRSPEGPSAEARRRHEVAGHWPFRSWCRHCLRGRGKPDPHKSGEKGEYEKPVISMDYCFSGR